MVDFIGIGAQKSGTSWAYACLYEHPEICAPVKEIHFFSRPRFSEGKAWYEDHFKSCKTGKLRGEFSTSYLYAKEAPERIHTMYPNVKLIAILRNPIDRAYSQYRNAIKAGEIGEDVTFPSYSATEQSVLEQGLYAAQIAHYHEFFPKEQMLILIYEDIRKDPIAFMRRIYAFLGVDTDFVSSMVHDEINVARVPKHVGVEKSMHRVAESLRRHGFDRFVHMIRKTGLPEMVRSLNTKKKHEKTATFDRAPLVAHFKNDVAALGQVVGRDMCREWNIQ